MHLQNYYYYFQKALTPRFCDELIKYGISKQEQLALTGNETNKKNLSQKDIKDLKKTIHSKVEKIMNVELEYDDIWVHKTPPRAQTSLHNHTADGNGPLCSFVYYPKFIEKQGSLKFIIFWNGRILEKIIIPKEKMLLIFQIELVSIDLR